MPAGTGAGWQRVQSLCEAQHGLRSVACCKLRACKQLAHAYGCQPKRQPRSMPPPLQSAPKKKLTPEEAKAAAAELIKR